MAAPRAYTVSELTKRIKGADAAKNPGNNLLKDAKLEVEYGKLSKEKQLAYGAVGYLFLQGRVAPDSAEASAVLVTQLGDLTAKTDAILKGVDESKQELVKSLEFTQKRQDTHEKDTAVLRDQIKQIRQDLLEKPVAAATAEPASAILISSLVDEEKQGSVLLDHVQSFLDAQVNPAVRITVQAVERMGRFEEGKGARRVKVVLGSAAEAQAVLRAARNLKDYNAERKAEGNRAVGIDHFLSQEELKTKRQLWPKWQEARGRQAPKTYWKGARLFVEGQEVLP